MKQSLRQKLILVSQCSFKSRCDGSALLFHAELAEEERRGRTKLPSNPLKSSFFSSLSASNILYVSILTLEQIDLKWGAIMKLKIWVMAILVSLGMVFFGQGFACDQPSFCKGQCVTKVDKDHPFEKDKVIQGWKFYCTGDQPYIVAVCNNSGSGVAMTYFLIGEKTFDPTFTALGSGRTLGVTLICTSIPPSKWPSGYPQGLN